MRRLILFDIDGTLLTAGGAGRRAIRDALVSVYGETGPIDGYGFGGRTDPEIAHALLSAAGWAPEAVEAELPRFWEVYLAGLRRAVDEAPHAVRALPGVPALLERIEAEGSGVVLGLLTGNVREGARIKVDAAGLGFDRFAVGAFGSDHAHRPELPAIAIERARARTGVEYAGKEVVIVGDTPFDVRCGEHLGVRTIATLTGLHPREELEACHPDHLFDDLTDLDAVWKAIAE